MEVTEYSNKRCVWFPDDIELSVVQESIGNFSDDERRIYEYIFRNSLLLSLTDCPPFLVYPTTDEAEKNKRYIYDNVLKGKK